MLVRDAQIKYYIIMNSKLTGYICVVSMLLIGSAGAAPSGDRALTFGMRQHVDHPTYAGLPFGDGDLSYLIAYEYHEGPAYWQMGLAFADGGSATSFVSEVSSVMTPQLHLIYKGRTFWGGGGVMKSYIREEEAYWTGFYWQFQAGLSFPLTETMRISAVTYWMFDDWGDIGDFGTDELEFGFNITYFY